jgi:hypothetical protein
MGARWKATAGAAVVGLVGSATILLLAVLFDSSGQEVAVPNRIDSPSPQQASSRPTTQARADTLAPDDDYEATLRNARFSTRGWKTDFSRHSIPYNEILSGGPPRDGIPPIDNPRFVTPEEAAAWLTDVEPVIALEVGGEAKTYPLQILTWHEIVNDTIGGVPVVATFCPLCNSAIVFDRRLNGTVYDFGTSGNLQFSNLIMWDRQTESWWQQFIGDAIVGELTGQRLDFLPATIISFADFREAHPDGQVLSRETGFAKAYGRTPPPTPATSGRTTTRSCTAASRTTGYCPRSGSSPSPWATWTPPSPSPCWRRSG